jgi:spore coat polysaccharide biosynthesis protein SpsF (cytidylyltransferase family)
MKKKKNIHIIIQARVGSKRLRNKILKKYKNLSPLKVMVERLKNCENINSIIICTTFLKEDDKIVKFCKNEKLPFFRGSVDNVLLRYYNTAKRYNSKIIIRVTSDCPFVDYRIINTMLLKFQNLNVDYYANTYPMPTQYPDGMDVEIFKFSTLKKTNKLARLPSQKEHVTPFMYESKKFKIKKKNIRKDFSKYRFCIDYIDDFKLFKKILDNFKTKIYNLSMNDLIKFVLKNPSSISYQKKIIRNEGWSSAFKKDERFK